MEISIFKFKLIIRKYQIYDFFWVIIIKVISIKKNKKCKIEHKGW